MNGLGVEVGIIALLCIENSSLVSFGLVYRVFCPSGRRKERDVGIDAFKVLCITGQKNDGNGGFETVSRNNISQ